MPSMNPTKTFRDVTGLSLLLAVSLPGAAHARLPELQYQFVPGVTNVYAVEITVQGENGQEVTTGNVFLTATEAVSNRFRLDWHSTLRTQAKPAFQPGMGFFGNPYPYGMPGLAHLSEMEIDYHGHVLRSTGDHALPAPLGELMQSLVPPLPTHTVEKKAIQDEEQIEDAPHLRGPINGFTAQSPFGPVMYMNNNDPHAAPALLAVARQTVWKLAANTEDTVTWKQATHWQSWLNTGAEPRLSAQSEATLDFNRHDGMWQRIEVNADLASVTETTSRKSKIHYIGRRLTGPDREAALAPPAPPVPATLTMAEIQKITEDLQATEPTVREQALTRLNAGTVAAPTQELLQLVATQVTGDNTYPRMQAINFLASHATKEQVPLLLKLLSDTDYGTQQKVIQALNRLHDDRAIEPLVDLVARGGSFNQEAVNALTGYGATAEPAVLTLFHERSTETRRQACAILQQIGTHASLDPLLKQMDDPDQSLNQAATQARQAINLRQ